MKHFMNLSPARWGVLVLACLLAAACQDRRDPVKPSVGTGTPVARLGQALQPPG